MFSSLRDIVSVYLVVKDLVKALVNGRGLSAEWVLTAHIQIRSFEAGPLASRSLLESI